MEILQADPWFRVFLYLKLDVMRIMRIIEGMRFKEIEKRLLAAADESPPESNAEQDKTAEVEVHVI